MMPNTIIHACPINSIAIVENIINFVNDKYSSVRSILTLYKLPFYLLLLILYVTIIAKMDLQYM